MNLQQIKNICTDIKSDDEWVCDSHDSAEHKGIIYGLDQLVKHLEEVSPKETDNNNADKEHSGEENQIKIEEVE